MAAQQGFDLGEFLASLGLRAERGQGLMEVLSANPQAVMGIVVTLAALLFARIVLTAARGTQARAFLDPAQFQPLRLVAKTSLNHNTRRFRFALPHPKMALGLPVGQHITFLAKDAEGKDVYRPYTPTSDNDQLGFVDFVIKVYPGGKMGSAMDAMAVGDTLLMKGPRGRFAYRRNMKRAIGMIAGGTGITPMYQVAQTVLRDAGDRTSFSLIFGNIKEEDILIRQELDALAAAYPGRFKVHYVLNDPPKGWTGGSGFISAEMIKAHLPAPGPDTLVLRCGPKPMCDAMKKHLDGLGYSEECQFEF